MSSQELCFPVSTAAIGLVDALFSTAVGNTVLSDGFSAHLRREVLWLAGSYAVDVWTRFNEWRYLIQERRFEIGKLYSNKANRRNETVPIIPQSYISSIHNRRSAFSREPNHRDPCSHRRSNSRNVFVTRRG
jgi:hypothetical protein